VAKRGGRFAKYAAARARAGDPYPLIVRLSVCIQCSGKPLTDDEFRFIRDVLEAKADRKTAARLRLIERMLVAEQVTGFIEDGMPRKQAIDKVKQQRNCSDRHIENALKQKRQGRFERI
jgi:hypothetical protein